MEEKIKKESKKKRPEIRIEDRFKFNDKVYIVNKPIIFSVHHVSGGKGLIYAINKPLALSTEKWPVDNWTDLEYEVVKTLSEVYDKYSHIQERLANQQHWLTCMRYFQKVANI